MNETVVAHDIVDGNLSWGTFGRAAASGASTFAIGHGMGLTGRFSPPRWLRTGTQIFGGVLRNRLTRGAVRIGLDTLGMLWSHLRSVTGTASRPAIC